MLPSVQISISDFYQIFEALNLKLGNCYVWRIFCSFSYVVTYQTGRISIAAVVSVSITLHVCVRHDKQRIEIVALLHDILSRLPPPAFLDACKSRRLLLLFSLVGVYRNLEIIWEKKAFEFSLEKIGWEFMAMLHSKWIRTTSLC